MCRLLAGCQLRHCGCRWWHEQRLLVGLRSFPRSRHENQQLSSARNPSRRCFNTGGGVTPVSLSVRERERERLYFYFRCSESSNSGGSSCWKSIANCGAIVAGKLDSRGSIRRLGNLAELLRSATRRETHWAGAWPVVWTVVSIIFWQPRLHLFASTRSIVCDRRPRNICSREIRNEVRSRERIRLESSPTLNAFFGNFNLYRRNFLSSLFSP